MERSRLKGNASFEMIETCHCIISVLEEGVTRNLFRPGMKLTAQYLKRYDSSENLLNASR